MSKISKLSNLVFRRNVPAKLEKYAFNCDMLQVFMAMDGEKTVAAIAASMNKPVEDLIAAFSSLYQQNLLAVVNQVRMVTPEPVSDQRTTNNTETDVSKKVKPPIKSEQSLSPIKESTETIPVTPQRAQIEYHLRNAEAISRSTSSNLLKASKSNGNGSKAVFQKTLKSEILNTKAKIEKSGGDIFNINRSRETKPYQSFNAILRSSDPPEAILPETKSAALFAARGSDNKSVNNSLVYFEKGLVFLQRRRYKEALHQFNQSLKLDPQNRLCRANIQRIRKLLEEQKECLKVTQ